MKLIRKTIILCLCIITLLSMGTISMTASAAEDIKVRLVSDVLKAKPGNKFIVSYSFENAADYKYGLAAFTSYLKFDSTKVRCVKVQYGTYNQLSLSTNRSLKDEVRTIYAFASTTKEPGVNDSKAFVNYEFIVTKEATGTVEFSLDFDTIITTNYDKNPIQNKALSFNKPTIKVEIVNDDATSSSTATSKPENSSSANTSKPTSNTSSKPTINSSSKPQNSSTNQISNASSEDEGTTVDKEFLNPDFNTDDITTGEEMIKEPTQSEAIEQTSSNLNSQLSKTESNSNGNTDDGDNKALIIAIIAAAGLLICGGVATIVILQSKKKN